MAVAPPIKIHNGANYYQYEHVSKNGLLPIQVPVHFLYCWSCAQEWM